MVSLTVPLLSGFSCPSTVWFGATVWDGRLGLVPEAPGSLGPVAEAAWLSPAKPVLAGVPSWEVPIWVPFKPGLAPGSFGPAVEAAWLSPATPVIPAVPSGGVPVWLPFKPGPLGVVMVRSVDGRSPLTRESLPGDGVAVTPVMDGEPLPRDSQWRAQTGRRGYAPL